MKLWYKKAYEDEKRKCEFLEQSYNELIEDYRTLMRCNNLKTESISELTIELKMRRSENIKLEKRIRTLIASKGGLTKSKNKITKELEELVDRV